MKHSAHKSPNMTGGSASDGSTNLSRDTASRTIWGLGVQEIHDAYWASHGVACVTLGSGVAPQKGADLYLLLEPHQGVHFDLRRIAEALLWNQAHITRIRVIEREAPQYSERVLLNAAGDVERIERRYGADHNLSGQVLLATLVKDAVIWSRASSATAAFVEMRRRGRLRVDATECAGSRYDLSLHAGQQALLTKLVETWAHPDHVIQGIDEIDAGVFAPAGYTRLPQDQFVAPVWIGSTDLSRQADAVPQIEASRQVNAQLAIGPTALWDTGITQPPKVPIEVVPIEELFASDTANRVEVTDDPGGWYAPLKRCIDVVGSLSALVISAPILLVCAIAVVIDDGFPIFFGHKRQTKGGATFRCWKFRTMRRNAESLVAELRKQNLCDGPQVNIKNDPRVTRVGKLLRKLQLDEFPQFWNVLVGDMSIVGPRPSPDNENQFCPAWREIRLSVRPGITGYWQVMRTREQGKDFQEWIQYDIAYVKRMGLVFDLWICIRTFINLARRK
ncbi:MAG: sugar transferase [Limnohabitans sp.]|nr:sugar transferase [Limnohabitans sp.]